MKFHKLKKLHPTYRNYSKGQKRRNASRCTRQKEPQQLQIWTKYREEATLTLGRLIERRQKRTAGDRGTTGTPFPRRIAHAYRSACSAQIPRNNQSTKTEEEGRKRERFQKKASKSHLSAEAKKKVRWVFIAPEAAVNAVRLLRERAMLRCTSWFDGGT